MNEPIDYIAVYAAIVATAVFGWDIIKWIRGGARLHLSASPNMEPYNVPDARVQGKRYIMVRAVNTGSSPTTITNLTTAQFAGWRQRVFGKPMFLAWVGNPSIAGSGKVPQILKPGEEWVGFIEQSGGLVKLATEGLLYAQVYHSVGKKPVRARIVLKSKD